jgi:hypothetical protein
MSHPQRRQLARRLSAELGDVPVVSNGGKEKSSPNALETSIEAWKMQKYNSTHHMVVQDDIQVSPFYAERVSRAISLFPDAIIAFYANWDSAEGAAVRLAVSAGCSWVTALNIDYFPTLAVVMPTNRADAFVKYSSAAPATRVHDDEVMLSFIKDSEACTILSAPSAVEHRQVKSLMGNRARKAACFLEGGSPGSNEMLARSFPICPYFAAGTAQCLIPTESSWDGSWRKTHWTNAVERIGLSPERLCLDRELDLEAALHHSAYTATERSFVFDLWLTSFLLAFLPARGLVERTLLDYETSDTLNKPSSAAIKHALRTLIPGGLMDSPLPQDTFANREADVYNIALRGYKSGVEKAKDPDVAEWQPLG